MLKHAIYIPIFAAAVALSACSQGSMSTNPLGSSAVAQPSHRERADLTSTSVTIQNKYSLAISLITQSASCLTGSPPSTVAADSTSASFSVSYTGTCAVDHGHFYMTYDPDAAAADACTFKIDYTPSSGVFTYSVVNGANTNCSYVLGGLPGVVAFIYAHS
jgi:hypothetical protein